jgi:hypothetical protein
MSTPDVKKVDYRRIYKRHHGSIPIDESGRTYDIHHIDKNRANNDISNLVALSIRDHYDLHWSQGDYGACLKIAIKMRKSPEELSEISKRLQKQLVENGTHPFLGRKHIHTRGTHWWNNGSMNVRAVDPPDENWVPGMLNTNSNKAKKWWNNGIISKMSVVCPGIGFEPGFLYPKGRKKRRVQSA